MRTIILGKNTGLDKIQYMTNEDKENILTEFINKMFEDIKDVPPEIQEAVDEHFFDLL